MTEIVSIKRFFFDIKARKPLQRRQYVKEITRNLKKKLRVIKNGFPDISIMNKINKYLIKLFKLLHFIFN